MSGLNKKQLSAREIFPKFIVALVEVLLGQSRILGAHFLVSHHHLLAA